MHKPGDSMQTFFVMLCLLTFFLFSCQDKGASSQRPDSKERTLKSAPAQVYFDGDCSEAILQEICEAKSDIFVQSNSRTSAAVVGALIEAHKRGLKVEAIIGKNQRKKKDDPAASLANAGIPVYVDGKRAISRNETILIDGKTVIAGPFDCSKAADDGDTEKLTVTRSPELAAIYRENWKKTRQHAKVYATKATPAEKTVPKRKP